MVIAVWRQGKAFVDFGLRGKMGDTWEAQNAAF